LTQRGATGESLRTTLPARLERRMPQKIVFSTSQLPADLDGDARLARWRDLYAENVVSYDVICEATPRFSASFELTLLDRVTVCRVDGMVQGIVREGRHIAADGRDDFLFGFNESASSSSLSQLGHELEWAYGDAALLSSAEGFHSRAKAENSWAGVCLPRERILELVPEASDLLARPLHSDLETLRHLRRYVRMLLQSEPEAYSPALNAHIETTLIDLVALALGAHRDANALASQRGLRAARLHEILLVIREGFTDGSFSSRTVARKIGVSPRYVQDLLQESGTSFAERVLELRLQKARKILSDRRYDRLKVSDIALDCGFNEVSYFNRCFRARFGASPTQYRGGS
jgi:AraC-like DNA-binding protein